MPMQTRKQIIDAGLEREVSIISLVSVWNGMEGEEKVPYAEQMCKIYGSKLSHPTKSQEFLQGFRALTNYLSM